MGRSNNLSAFANDCCVPESAICRVVYSLKGTKSSDYARMFFISNMTVREIARACDVSSTTVQHRLSDMRRVILQKLKEDM